jgi:hypothetical protein
LAADSNMAAAAPDFLTLLISSVTNRGGDLLQLARSTPADIVGAGRLAQHAQRLKSSGKLSDEHYNALLTRAQRAIHDHMYVHDAEKIALSEDYEAAMEYKGHCCAVCGIRDPELEYTEMCFRRNSSGWCTDTVRSSAGLPANMAERVVHLQALPEWLRVDDVRVVELQDMKRKVYVEHDGAPGQFVRTEISALDMRHIMHIRNIYVHLIEEAVDMTSPDGVALMFVCSRCVDTFPSASTRKHKRATSSAAADSTTPATSGSTTIAAANPTVTTAAAVPNNHTLDDDDVGAARKDPRPVLSMARRDYGRRYLPAAAVDRLRSELRTVDTATEEVAEQLLVLPPCSWRVPIASKLETMLLAKSYQHIMSLKVAVAAGSSVSRHASLQKHTMYFPHALLDCDNIVASRAAM